MTHQFRWVYCNRRDYPLVWILILCLKCTSIFSRHFKVRLKKKSTSFFKIFLWYKETESNFKINLTSLMYVSMLFYIWLDYVNYRIQSNTIQKHVMQYLCFSLFRLLTHYQILVSFYVLFISQMHTVLFKKRHLKRYMVTIFFIGFSIELHGNDNT